MKFARVRALAGALAATAFGCFIPAALTGQTRADSAARDSALKADSLYWTGVLEAARAQVRLGSANDSVRRVAIEWLNAPIYFRPGEATIEGGMMEVMQLKGDLLKENKSLQVDLTGYADSVGDSVSNKKISLARAETVKQFLVSYGVDRGQLDVAGAGEAVLTTSNDLARRVDFGVLSNATMSMGEGVLSRILRLMDRRELNGLAYWHLPPRIGR